MRFDPCPVPHRPGRQRVTLDSHHATFGVSRCAFSHAATSRVSHIRRRPTLIAGAKRPSCRSHRTVSTDTRSRSATSSIVSSSQAVRVRAHAATPKHLDHARPLLPVCAPHSVRPAIGPVGDGVQQPPGVVHVVRVARRDGLPGVAGRVGCRNTERPQQPVLAVGPVVGQRLAGPLAGDQHPAPGVAEVIGVVGLALAPAGGQAGPGVLGLDAVAEPVRAPRRARLVPQRLGQPGGMRPLRRRCRPGGSRRPAWSGTWSGSRCTGPRPWTRRARPGRRTGPRTGPRGTAGRPGRWRRAPGPRWAGLPRWPGRGSPPVGLVPDGQLVAVVLDGAGVGPPDLVVGGGQDPAQLGAGDGAAHGDVDVRGEAPLGFDGGEVLHVVAEVAAQVLDEPVEQRGEGQRVPGGPVIVVGGRVGGCAVLADPAVGRAGQRDEQGRAEGLAVRRGVGLADRAAG